MIKTLLRYGVLILFFVAGGRVIAQRSVLPDDDAALGDTLSHILLASNSETISATGTSFSKVWAGLNRDNMRLAADEVRAMYNKKLPLRPYLFHYANALTHAVESEGLNDQKLKAYLETCGKVIERENNKAINDFLVTSAKFFASHELFSNNSYRLIASEADYTFEYVQIPELTEALPQEIVEEEVPEETEPENTDEDMWVDDWQDDDDGYNEEEWQEEPSDDDWDTEWDENPEEDQSFDDPQALIGAMGAEPLPLVEGPVIRFDRVTLNFATPYDSVFLQNTTGSLKLVTSEFVGEGGKFTWAMAGLPEDEVYAGLGAFSFDTRKPDITSEGAKMHYSGKLAEEVEGYFHYRSVRHDSTNTVSYPRFTSYYSNIPVQGFGPDIHYTGGFALQGKRMISTSILGDLSTVRIDYEGNRRMKASAKVFEFEDSVMRSPRAKVVIYQGVDSVYHPAVRLKYDIANRNLVIQKDKGGYRNTPYTTSYFNMDFTADIIRFDLASDSLDISILEARRLVPAYFESIDHYKYEDYTSLGDQVYNFNPLSMAVAYANREGTDIFHVADLASRYNKKVPIIQGAMLSLAQKGLIGYDANTGLVTIKEKGRHLYSSKQGQKDFDNIILSSVIKDKPNASLNWKEGYMTVRGVEKFKISDSLNVVIEPDSSTITLLKDRNFRFNGKITAGNYEYYGRDFTFRYDSFLIRLNEIDSIQFYVKDVNSRGGQGRKKINNSLVSDADGATSGTLFINRPNNKSGKINYDEFPKFDTGRGSIVYFDNDDVFDGVYQRSINFVVPPFAVDSLSGDDPTTISFKGQFVSDIFPTFDARLEVMPDNSMGFKYNTDANGLNLYGTNSTYYNAVKLDKQGLRGKGKIAHLSSEIESDDFIFYPDSVVTTAKSLVMKNEAAGNTVFPQGHLENFGLKWMPHEDRMTLKTGDSPFKFYNDFAALDGETTISSDGVVGKGKVLSKGSHLESEEIHFENKSFTGRHSTFEKLSDNPDKPLVEGNDVKVTFDLNDSSATISPEVEGEAAIQFPYAQFNTSITEAKWDLQQEKIFMSKPEDVPIESSYFYTTREDLDSLAFNATNAEYDLKSNELKVSGIPYITVADARITPENGEVLILENSKIGRLTNTVIVLDTLNGYHTLTDGVIDIISRNEFTGYATYHFINSLGDSVAVRFENFHLQTTETGTGKKKKIEKHTIADGYVREEQDAMVAPGMYYKGGMKLQANKPSLELDGYIKLDLDEPGYDTWIKHQSSGNEKQVFINFQNNITEDGRPVTAGLHFSSYDNSLYRTFITQKLSPDDEDFFKAGGVLFYDEESEDFVIEDTAKAMGSSLAGKIFRYNKHSGNIRFEGPAKFIPSYKDASFKSAVIGTGNMTENTFAINTMLAVDFSTVPDQIFEAMAMDIVDVINNLGAPEMMGDPTNMLYKLADVAGERTAREYEKASQQEYIPLGGFTNETTVSLFFPNIDFKWSEDYNAFYNVGKISLSNIDKLDINAAFDGFMEIRHNDDGGAIFNCFIKASGASWFYFSYEDNRLLMFSSSEVFNQLVSEKSNGAKAKIGDLVFAPADKAETLAFINKFRSNYLGINDEYFLDSEVEQVVDEKTDGFGGTEKKDDTADDDDGGF